MKTIKNNRESAGRLAKYLSGEMSEQESHLFEAEISASESDIATVEQLKKQWSAMKASGGGSSPDARKAWNKLHDRLRGERLIPEQAASKNRFMRPLLQIAAAALILLGTGAIIFLNTGRKQQVEMVRVNTGLDENTLIKTLADGSVIYIAQNSLFSFPHEFRVGSRNVELKGEAFFDVAPNHAKPFIIETDEARIQVLGTAFNVKTKNGTGFELFVERGKVKVTMKRDPGNSETVMAGEKISAVKNRMVKSKHIADETTAWYKKRMHFKDEPLENIIHVLNLNFNTTFVLADHETGKHRMTVTFRNETAETMTELICVTLNLKSQNIHGTVVLSETREGAKQN